MANVLLIPVDFYPNSTGFANATLNLVNAITEYHPEINVTVYADVLLGNQEEVKGINVIRKSKFRAFSSYSRYKEICKIVEGNDIDFILIETNTVFFLQNLLVKRFPDKVAVRIHSTADTETLLFRKNTLVSRIFKKSAFDFMKNCRYILCTNTYHQGFIYDNFYNKNVYTMWEKSHFLLPNTVPAVVLDNKPQVGNYFFALGKLSYDGYIQKGISDLINACYLLKKKGIDVPLEIVGDGECYELIKKQIEHFGLTKVRLIKKMQHNEVIDHICNSRAVLLVSRYEGQSMFATEALSVAKPLIITRDNGMKDMLKDGRNGFLVDTGNCIDIADKIEHFLHLSDDEVVLMGQKSLEIYNQHFSPKRISDLMSLILSFVKP